MEGLAEHLGLVSPFKPHVHADLVLFSKAAICDESPKLYPSKKLSLVNGKGVSPTFIFMQMVPAEWKGGQWKWWHWSNYLQASITKFLKGTHRMAWHRHTKHNQETIGTLATRRKMAPLCIKSCFMSISCYFPLSPTTSSKEGYSLFLIDAPLPIISDMYHSNFCFPAYCPLTQLQALVLWEM